MFPTSTDTMCNFTINLHLYRVLVYLEHYTILCTLCINISVYSTSNHLVHCRLSGVTSLSKFYVYKPCLSYVCTLCVCVGGCVVVLVLMLCGGVSIDAMWWC